MPWTTDGGSGKVRRERPVPPGSQRDRSRSRGNLLIALLVVTASAAPPLFETVRELPRAVRIPGQLALLLASGVFALFLDRRRERQR
jgi:hypothetical protein